MSTSMKHRDLRILVTSMALLVFATSCGSDTTTYINFEVRVISTATAPLTAGGRVIAQVSTDGFVTVLKSGSTRNDQGLGTVPVVVKDAPVSTANPYVEVRAFQDTNESGAWEAGEPTGRYDGTVDGNGSFRVILTEENGTSVFSGSATVKGIDVHLDGTAAQ